jgi:hypothetical protein
MRTMATQITTADLASELHTDPRTVRKFLREITPREDQPGKGSRWTLERRQLRSLKAQFVKFQSAQAEKAAAAEKNKAKADAED